jgi:hypothetical protein
VLADNAVEPTRSQTIGARCWRSIGCADRFVGGVSRDRPKPRWRRTRILRRSPVKQITDLWACNHWWSRDISKANKLAKRVRAEGVATTHLVTWEQPGVAGQRDPQESAFCRRAHSLSDRGSDAGRWDHWEPQNGRIDKYLFGMLFCRRAQGRELRKVVCRALAATIRQRGLGCRKKSNIWWTVVLTVWTRYSALDIMRQFVIYN